MKTRLATRLSMAAACPALLLALACGESEAPPPPPAAAPAPAPAPAGPAPPPPAKAPSAAPAAAGGGDPAAGKVSYETYCVSCHGLTGAGDGPVGVNLDPRPAAHNDPAYMNGLTDAYVFQVIKEGGATVGKSPLMAPWGGTLTDAQIRNVIAYIRTLSQ